MSTTRLERRIAEVAAASGRNVYVGRKGHNDDWFAGCGDIESEGVTAWTALLGVVAELKQKTDSAEALYRSQMTAAERVRAL